MADENETNNDAVETKAQTASSGKNPLVTVLLVLNLVAMSVMSFLTYDFMQKEASKPSVKDIIKQEMKTDEEKAAEQELLQAEDQSQGKLLALDGFTVNLAKSDGPRRFVRLQAVLKFSNDSKEGEFNTRKPQIRDTIISILNSKRPEDLLKREGKTYLKEEIKAAINAFLIDGELVDVFYVGFQIN